MQRISTASAVPDLYGPGMAGFTDGDPVGGIAPTFLNAAWFGSVQEELAGVVEGAGEALLAARRDQLLTALHLMIAGLATITVISRPDAPPANPALYSRYVVGANPSGAWVGRANQIAVAGPGAWRFIAPSAGWQVQLWSGRLIVLGFDGAAWAEDLATTLAAGRIELADAPETRAGARADLAVSPATLFAARSALRVYSQQTYDTPGTYSFVVPADITRVFAQVWAGGGGNTGDAQAGGGGGGGYAEGFITTTPGQSLTAVVGARGAAGLGASSANGGSGGSSSFGGISATGGGGGQTNSAGGKTQGAGSGGAFQYPGGGGGNGGYYLSGNNASAVGGFGAPAYQQSLIMPELASGGGVNGFGPGTGGSGSSRGTNRNGGLGGAGRIILTW